MPNCKSSSKYKTIMPSILLVALIAGCPTAFAEQGWKLTQTAHFLGPQTTIVSKKGISIDAPEYGLRFVVTAPSYKLLVINDRQKIYALEDYSEWNAQTARLRSHTLAGTLPTLKKGPASVASMKAEEYLVKYFRNLKDPALPTVNGVTYDTELYVAKNLVVPRQFSEVFTLAGGIPCNLGFPIRLVRHYGRGRSDVEYDTFKVQPVKVAVDTKVPRDYRKAEDAMSVFMSPMRQMQSFGQGAGGMPFGGSRSPAPATSGQKH